MIKNLYRTLVPRRFRQFAWDLRGTIYGLYADHPSRAQYFDMDYDTYWKARRDMPNQYDISYEELVGLCCQIVTPNARVLDFGCGSGELLKALKACRDIEELGIDVSQVAVDLARANGVNCQQLELHYVDDLAQFGHFDYAIATEVLEHVPNSELILLSLTKYASTVLISIPNTGYFKYRLRLLFGRFPRQWIYHPSEHVRFWTVADVHFMAKQLDLEILNYVSVSGGRLGKINPSLFASDILYTIRKRVPEGMVSESL